jgi:hypothetical protein
MMHAGHKARVAQIHDNLARTGSASDDTLARLNGLYAVAKAAEQDGTGRYGDYRWHGGSTDFAWDGVKYDAPGFIEYARGEIVRRSTGG